MRKGGKGKGGGEHCADAIEFGTEAYTGGLLNNNFFIVQIRLIERIVMAYMIKTYHKKDCIAYRLNYFFFKISIIGNADSFLFISFS